ncbi:hypothetical protein EPO15_01930 [bacterium]|nr:MAG: hypothetical protein EPO15_01930 [bacterium]
MKTWMLAALLAAPALAAEAPGTPQKGLPLQRKADCLNAATFDSFLNAGADSWGVEEAKAKQAVDLLEAAVQCKAWTSGTEEPCRQLGMVPKFPAGKLLEANCRSEHHLLAFYDALARKDAPASQRACVRWYELNKGQMLEKAKGEEVCARLTALTASEPATACKRLGSELGDQAVEPVCAAVWTPSAKACARAEGLPFEKRRCDDYAKVRAALVSRKAEDCPKSARMQGLCRAMLDKDPVPACDAPRKAWQELLCAGRFQER